MPVELSPLEQRVIGCLIEKQIATPDQYPLSLNALANACNQRSNRDPVLDLDETTVQGVIDGLARRQLVLERSGFGSRVPKYQHLFCNTQFGSQRFTPQETALVCELLLRGPQTPGELRSRASRLAAFADVAEVETALDALASRPEGACVERLAREPGRREARFRHLFGDAPAAAGTQPPDTSSRLESPAEGELAARVADLEATIGDLERRLDALERGLPLSSP
jgi:uncharacterized protein YceH (UPF0502 family)